MNLNVLSCTVSYSNLVVNMNRNLAELKDLFNQKYNNEILTYELKEKICSTIVKEGFSMIGGCNLLDTSSNL